MARDYKSRANPSRGKQQPTSGWIWFSAGVLVGAFSTGLAWLKSDEAAPESRVATVVPAPQAEHREEPVSQSVERPEPSRPRFDFYTILPEMEVVVPEPEERPKEIPTTTPVEEQPIRVEENYMLQMGSFHKYADADRLKASLALVGIEAEIQRVTVNAGEIFHRVRSGPYGRKQVNSLRARLKSNNINSLVIKLKG